ncbi:MAG: hypothetical protein JF606_25745 [Burkholderiales bacterium]|nr:hypothetical protein [Burkholderiales bacterium]
MSVDYFLVRLYDNGQARPKHLTVRRGLRGSLVVREEPDPERQRMVRVARFHEPSITQTAVPPLFDVVLLGCTSEWMSLTGFERIVGGSLQDPTFYAQSWWLSAAPLEDLLAAERRVNELSEQLQALKVSTEK